MKIKTSKIFWTVETKQTSISFSTRDHARSHKKILKKMYKGKVGLYKNTYMFQTDLMPDTVVLYKERKH